MADIRVPPNCTSITFAVSGVKAPVNNIITGLTPAEATEMTSPYSAGPGNLHVKYTAPNGDTDLFMPGGITSITIGGQVKAVSNGAISALSGAIASAFLLGARQRGTLFELVQG